MKQKEMISMKTKKLYDLEEEAKERAQNLLQRANKLRIEQEEELRDMSKVGPLHFPLLLSSHWTALALAGGGARRGRGEGLLGGWGRKMWEELRLPWLL